jgi:hypothetical protein
MEREKEKETKDKVQGEKVLKKRNKKSKEEADQEFRMK